MTHALWNWRKTNNLEKTLSNSDTSATELSVGVQITYKPATNTVPKFHNSSCVGAVSRMENWKTGIVQTMEKVSSHYHRNIEWFGLGGTSKGLNLLAVSSVIFN